jgi:hypothetical protein
MKEEFNEIDKIFKDAVLNSKIEYKDGYWKEFESKYAKQEKKFPFILVMSLSLITVLVISGIALRNKLFDSTMPIVEMHINTNSSDMLTSTDKKQIINSNQYSLGLDYESNKGSNKGSNIRKSKTADYNLISSKNKFLNTNDSKTYIEGISTVNKVMISTSIDKTIQNHIVDQKVLITSENNEIINHKSKAVKDLQKFNYNNLSSLKIAKLNIDFKAISKKKYKVLWEFGIEAYAGFGVAPRTENSTAASGICKTARILSTVAMVPHKKMSIETGLGFSGSFDNLLSRSINYQSLGLGNSVVNNELINRNNVYLNIPLSFNFMLFKGFELRTGIENRFLLMSHSTLTPKSIDGNISQNVFPNEYYQTSFTEKTGLRKYNLQAHAAFNYWITNNVAVGMGFRQNITSLVKEPFTEQIRKGNSIEIGIKLKFK